MPVSEAQLELTDRARALLAGPVPGTDLTIGITSPERSIADAYRLRGDLGYEIPRDALKEWLRRGGKPAALIETASHLPRTKGPILQALELLT